MGYRPIAATVGLCASFLLIHGSATGATGTRQGLQLHISEVSMEGNHVKDVDRLFRELKYKVIRTYPALGWDALDKALSKYGTDHFRVTKAVYFDHGWTHVVDDEMVISSDRKVLGEESQRLKSKIVGWVCESTSGSYGVWVYAGGHLVRCFVETDGKPVEQAGKRLDAEKRLDWKTAGAEDVVALAGRLGPGFDNTNDRIKFLIYDLDEHSIAPD